jgi:hypothetical protein
MYAESPVTARAHADLLGCPTEGSCGLHIGLTVAQPGGQLGLRSASAEAEKATLEALLYFALQARMAVGVLHLH